MKRWILFVILVALLFLTGCNEPKPPDPNILKIAALEQQVTTIERTNTILSGMLLILGIAFAGLAAVVLNRKAGGANAEQ